MAGIFSENTYQLTQSVVMIGMMGAGKTAVGRALADLLHVPFVDSDHEIEAAAKRTIAEIFERDGETFFRSRETEIIARILSGKPSIVSTGGGAFLQARNRDTISEGGVAVWLKADLDLLWERVRHKTTRPLLRTDDPKATLEELYHQRTPVYAEAAISVEAEPGLSIAGMAEKVALALLDHGVLVVDDAPHAK